MSLLDSISLFVRRTQARWWPEDARLSLLRILYEVYATNGRITDAERAQYADFARDLGTDPDAVKGRDLRGALASLTAEAGRRAVLYAWIARALFADGRLDTAEESFVAELIERYELDESLLRKEMRRAMDAERVERTQALALYVHELPPVLVERYGYAETYSPGQVCTAIEKAGLSTRAREYACAMFCSRVRFVEWVTSATLSTDGDEAGKAGAEAGGGPYRTEAEAPVDEEDRGARYRSLREEVAEEHNEGSQRFMARVAPGSGGGGDDAGAVANEGGLSTTDLGALPSLPH